MVVEYLRTLRMCGFLGTLQATVVRARGCKVSLLLGIVTKNWQMYPGLNNVVTATREEYCWPMLEPLAEWGFCLWTRTVGEGPATL